MSQTVGKRRVAVVSNTAWFIYNFHLRLLHDLVSEGYEVAVIAPADAYAERLEKMGFGFHHIAVNSKGTNPIEDIKLIGAFRRLYGALSPDAILQFTIKPNVYGSLAAGTLGIPVISTITGLGTIFLNDRLSSRIGRLLYKVALKVPKRVFFLNRSDRELFVHSRLVAGEKAAIMPGSGIDTEAFRPVEKAGGGTVRFLMIARLIRDKGIVEYVEAAKQVHDPLKNEFGILGAYYPGNPTAVTEAQMQSWEAEGTVRYLGTSDDVASVIASADCVVLPSYREGISQVLLEAASMAKPIVTTDVPGCREVVEDGVNGYLCRVKDTASLAESLRRICALSDAERETMGRKGREKVLSEFDEKVVNRRYCDAVAEIVGR